MPTDPTLPPDDYSGRPVPPADPIAPVLPGSGPGATSTGLDPKVSAGVAAIVPLLGGIIFYVIEKKNQYVRHWAMQTIFFGAAWSIFGVVVRIIAGVLGPVFLLGTLWVLVAWVVNLAFVVVWIIGILKAFSGQTWEYPVVGKMAREQFSRTPGI